jgi:hypothetical protein
MSKKKIFFNTKIREGMLVRAGHGEEERYGIAITTEMREDTRTFNEIVVLEECKPPVKQPPPFQYAHLNDVDRLYESNRCRFINDYERERQ